MCWVSFDLFDNRRVKVIRVNFDAVQVNFTLMQIWEDHQLFGLQIEVVDHNVQKFVALERIERRIHLDLLVVLEVQDLVILVEDLIVVEVSGELVLDQVVSDLDDVIIKVDMAVDQGVGARAQDSLQGRILYQRLQDDLVVLLEVIDFQVELIRRGLAL